MKTHLSDILIRLTVVTAMVMTALGALVSFAPASAAPVQGDGYWTDTFSDTTGITAPINISVSGGDVRLNTSSTIIQVPTSCNDATYPNAQNYEWYSQWTPPGSGTVTVTKLWYWQVDNSLSSSETIYMAMYVNGGGYTKISGSDATLKGTGAAGWISADVTTPFNITLGQSYWIGLASASGTSYGLARDNSANCANYPPTGSGSYYPTNNYVLDASVPTGSSQSTNKYIIPGITYTVFNSTGSLNSVSITPSNLQSWGTFNASDHTTCLPYRKPISITGTGTPLTDYQVNISVIYVSGKMNADFSDLRFKDSSGNILSYWIESYVASTSAQVWVKVPSIALSGTTTIYMYYGNAAAVSSSNGPNTFTFFDDFSGDLSKWTKEKNPGNISIVSGYLNCSGGSTASPYGHTVLGSSASYTGFADGIIEGKTYLSPNGIAEVGYRGNYAANTGYKSRMDNRAVPDGGIGNLIWPYVVGVWTFISTGGGPLAPPVPSGAWYSFRITVNGSSMGISCAGQTLTGTNTTYTGPGEISLQNHFGAYVRFDDIRVRKYA